MNQLASPSDIRTLGTILSVWAHPDDETFASGGIMATAIQNGQKVICLTATKGEAGIQDESRWPGEHLGEIRAEEMAQALNILGVKIHHFLGYPDGGCQEVPFKDAVNKISQYIKKYQPDTILTFGPDGITGHDDHRTVSAWVREATKDSDITVYQAVQLRQLYDSMKEVDKQFNFFFNIDKPRLVEEKDCDLLFCLPDDLLIKKYQALCSMPSQYEALTKQFSQEAICKMVCSEAFVRA